ncbi:MULTISPECIES: hypothetical protein [Xanthobacter]|nr:hypothetical protein [Xanthobacter autotrophicus]
MGAQPDAGVMGPLVRNGRAGMAGVVAGRWRGQRRTPLAALA